MQAIAVLAIVKIVVGPLGLLVAVADIGGPPIWIYLVNISAFAFAAAYLTLGSRTDRRATYLAVTFLLIASTFSDRLILGFGESSVGVLSSVVLLARLEVVGFLPYTTWSFFEEFPRTTEFGWGRRLARLARRSCGVVGVALFVANLVSPDGLQAGASGGVRSVLLALSGSTPNSLFWPIVFVLTVAGLLFGILKARSAPLEERRRVGLLTAGLLVGGAPILLLVMVTELFPAAREAILQQPAYSIAQSLVYPFLLSILVTTAYAVHVHQALDVRFFLRKAAQYALARYTLLVAAALPFVALAVVLYLGRDQTLAELVTGGPGVVLLVAGVLGTVGVRVRGRMVTAVDRRFFREQYDAQRILRDLVDASRRVIDTVDLEKLLTAEVNRALHLESAVFVSLERELESLVSRTNSVQPLSLDSTLVTHLQERGEPLQIDLELPGGGVGELPLDEREWLAAGGFRLVCPLADSQGALIGILALGEKRSELPFTDDDRALLSALTASAAVTLEKHLLAPSDRDRYSSVSLGRECLTCGAVSSRESQSCPSCGGEIEVTRLPLEVGGKFRIQHRIGKGGMGVVYRATDLTLGRDVAIKTLPKMGALLAWRLRREARAMASVTHPNLALVYGTESWGGNPILVVEYLAGGTLGALLSRGPLAIDAALDLGIVLADVTDCIHRAGILHRDIKPSNIGYTGDGVPKLLDFGLAKMLETARESETGIRISDSGRYGVKVGLDEEAHSASETAAGVLLGTVDYLSPEAANGEEPHPSFDLWSVAVVLYEAISCTNPFSAPTVEQTLYQIFEHVVPDIRELRPDCPVSVAGLFDDILAADRRKRPQSARVLGSRLWQARRAIGGARARSSGRV